MVLEWRGVNIQTHQAHDQIDLRAPERLCFDSPGGSFIGGVKLAHMLRGVSTGVDAGRQCESACFIAFMSGYFNPQEDRQWFADRVMHPTSTVGFHRPGLVVGFGEYSDQELLAAWEVSLDATDMLLDLSSSGPSGLGVELLSLIYDVPSATVHYIKTVDDANTFGITVFPVLLPELHADRLEWYAANACAGLSKRIRPEDVVFPYPYRSYFDREVPNDAAHFSNPYRHPTFRAETSSAGQVVLETLIQDEAAQACSLEFRTYWSDINAMASMRPNWGGGDVSIGEVGFGDASDDWFLIPSVSQDVGAFMLHHGSVLIADLPYGDERAVLRANISAIQNLRDWVSASTMEDVAVSCDRSDNVVVINVNEYVNIRSQPYLGSQIVARAQLGERLTLPSPTQWWALDTPSGRRCSELCNEAVVEPELRANLQQCIDDAEIWQEVRNERGQTGYVSVFFLGVSD